LSLLAEAQSALRAAVDRLEPSDDEDQVRAFEWLKETAARHGVFIKRFMRADDRANPSKSADLIARARATGSAPRTPSRPAPAPKPEPDDDTEEPTTAEVEDVRRLLSGRRVVLIGGDCRRDAQAMLERAFGLKDLVWLETKEHQSVATFEPAIARDDVALVLLAIRWSSHAFTDTKRYCDRHGKPLVRLPGGYNPNQVATQILAQCSDQLRGEL
jgi:hypothetical protein